METLPTEIIELIFNACEAKTLAVSIPRVSKLFRKLGGDNSNIWKAKCELKQLDLNDKPPDQTWKQYYFTDKLKLFPLFGFTLTKTTHQELLAAPGAQASVSANTDYVIINEHKFWIDSEDKFDMMYMTYTDTMPDDWVAQGLSWSIPFTELKQLLKKKVGNYQVTKVPHQGGFQGADSFVAGITTVVKEGQGEDAFHYEFSFNFNYKTGTETSPNTLYAITILGYSSNNTFGKTMNNEYRDLYEKQQCNDKPKDNV